MTVGFDIISDLNLDAEESFNWEGKATSLYLILAGNISDDLRVIRQTLLHLSKFYQGIFYIPGTLEHPSMHLVKHRYEEISEICKEIRNVAYLYKHVVIVNGVAILAATGWYGHKCQEDTLSYLHLQAQNFEDISYLSETLTKLQLHVDVKKIIAVTNCVPSKEFYFGENPSTSEEMSSPITVLEKDTERKISHWIFGTYNKPSIKVSNNITYINNGYFKSRPYWPRRIEVKI